MGFQLQNYTVQKTQNGFNITSHINGVNKLYYSVSPDGFSSDNFLCEFVNEVTVEDDLPNYRVYFHILNGGLYSVASERHVVVDGMRNVRELGGYNTEDQKSFVKPGVIFRSGHLAKVTEGGLKTLEDIGFKYILDFRAANETENLLDKQVSGASMKTIPAIIFKDGDESAGNSTFVLRDFLSEPREKRLRSKTMLTSHYKEMPFSNEAYKDLFKNLLNDNVPIMFHCAAGKDRTGVAALLILLVLGVPVETAVYDYMLTATGQKEFFASLIEKNKDLFLNELDYIIFDEVMSVRESNIRYTVEEIFKRYSDIESFAVENLDISYDDIAILRDKYLISH